MQLASYTVQPHSNGAVLSETGRPYMQLASHAVQPQSNGAGAVLSGTRRLYMQLASHAVQPQSLAVEWCGTLGDPEAVHADS